MKRVAIAGAGPIGLEAALYAFRLGHQVRVYERSAAGENVGRWGHVPMFTPWRMNVSSLGTEELGKRGWSAPDPEAFPTGNEYRERYLLPLAEALGAVIEPRTEVLGVSRRGLLKGEAIGGDRRAGFPFHLLLRRGSEEAVEEADVFIDATGTYGNHNSLGEGGLPAPGERAVASKIEYGLPDIAGRDRAAYEGRPVLLVGAGHSAATSLKALAGIRSRAAAGPLVYWAWRSERAGPFTEVPEDPLPGRLALARDGNRLAEDRPGWLRTLGGRTIASIRREGDSFRVVLKGRDGGSEVANVGRIIASIGYRPDLALERELQAHFCYASEGSMRLAAKLLGAGSDCLKMPAVGPDAYRHPEPGLFVLGQKGHGRSSTFLLRSGREGVRDAFRIVASDPDLDLYGGLA